MSSGRLPHPCCTASRDIRLRGGIPTHFDAGPLGIECRTTSALANFLNKMDGCRSDQLEARGTRARIKMLCHKPCIFDSVLFLVGPREALFVEPRQLGFALRSSFSFQLDVTHSGWFAESSAEHFSTNQVSTATRNDVSASSLLLAEAHWRNLCYRHGACLLLFGASLK